MTPNIVLGENHVAMESSMVTFKCKSTETPFWLERTKSISMAYGTNKRKNFNNNRLVTGSKSLNCASRFIVLNNGEFW